MTIILICTGIAIIAGFSLGFVAGCVWQFLREPEAVATARALRDLGLETEDQPLWALNWILLGVAALLAWSATQEIRACRWESAL